ncbi:MAG: S9 family peptidase, partial [Sulfolobales archaeon]
TSTERNGVDFDLYVYNEDFGVRLVAELEGTNSCSSWIGEDRVLVVHMNTNLDSDIYLVSTHSGEVRNLTKHYGEARNTNPRVIDDKRFFFLTNEGQEYVNIALYDLEKMEWRYVYKADHDIEDLDLSPSGESLVFTENYEGYSRAYIASSDFSRVELLSSPEGVIGTVSWGSAGIFYDVSGPRLGHELFVVARKEPARRVTKSPTFSARVEEGVAPQAIHYESWDGMRIPALLYRPKVGRPPYPAVVVLHGGPEGQARPSFDPLIQVLVRLGYLVLAPNFRGSAGYGKTFIHLDDREKRLDSLKDIGALVDWAEREGLVVKGRIAVTGASYGGYATLMSMVLFPDYWSCGVERVGIVNLVTFIKNTGPWRRKYRAYEYGDPETMADVMLQLSPISHIEKMKAPLMVVHGENDPRVPISEAEQLVEAMKKLGREVEFIRIGDEGHGVARVRNRVTVFTRIVRFIVKHTPVE